MSAVDSEIRGGRVNSDGQWPSPNDWINSPAYPRDSIFADDDAAEMAFADRFAALRQTMETTSTTRDELIVRLMNLAGKRSDLVAAVDFDRFPVHPQDGSYASPQVLAGDDPLSTFNARIGCARGSQRPKQSVLSMEVTDHVIRGLPMPHTISVRFNLGDFPWIIGAVGQDHGIVWLNVPGKDNDVSAPVESKELWRFADAEALTQSLDFCAEIAIELFGQPAEAVRANPAHEARRTPRYMPGAYSPLRYRG